jgi:hypothetical protein
VEEVLILETDQILKHFLYLVLVEVEVEAQDQILQEVVVVAEVEDTLKVEKEDLE